MGLTVVRKSDPKQRRERSRVALVLAGGAVTGGAFKVGGLKALDDYLVNRKTTDFDIYVGLSAGSVLASALSAGISPAEMIKSLEGKSEELSAFRPLDLYWPNVSEIVERPVELALALAAFVPGTLVDLAREVPGLVDRLREPLAAYIRRPTPSGLRELLWPIADVLQKRRPFPSPFEYVPSGLFDNRPLERYIRKNLQAAGISNDFRAHYRQTGRELYISAMNLDTAERVVFGHDEDASLTISEAVQASTALPGFYKPARIKGVDYVDGGVRRTANIDVAIEHGAELIICYNPFRPFSNRVRRRFDPVEGRYVQDGRPLADSGLFTVLNQVLRTLLHSRLRYGLREYQQDPDFHGDIIVIEPKETDYHFFQLSAMSYWDRVRAAQLGYVSVTESIDDHYDLVRPILQSHGIAMTRREVRRRSGTMREGDTVAAAELLERDVPRRKLQVA